MADDLRDPLLYPNWLWLSGAALIVVAIAGGLTLLLAYRYARVQASLELKPLSQIRQERYFALLQEISTNAASGQTGARETHLALSALIRAAASERLQSNVESLSVREAGALRDRWPAFADALAWGETPSFSASDPHADAKVEEGIRQAEVVISG